MFSRLQIMHAYVRLESIAVIGIVPTYGYKYDLYNYKVYLAYAHTLYGFTLYVNNKNVR